MPHQENSYKNFPALASYIDRIGARELSFKTFMVETYVDHYYSEKCHIRINTEDRTISCTNPAYAPSQAENDLILAELANRQFPQPIGADDISGLIRTIERKGYRIDKKDLFELWGRTTNKIVMVQRRFQAKGEKKQYHPWTLFDDGEWRQMEPGGPLPFWKPRKKISNAIMVHEGAKAARFCEWLCRSNEYEAQEARKAHPWASELDRFEHWGIIGGALAPHRADYSELRRERPGEVVYVADNDDQGRRVLNTFSRLYEGQLKWVKFDSRWPTAWDLADNIPIAFFGDIAGHRHYIGPTLASLMNPATYATETVEVQGRGRPAVVLRSSFAEEWYHSVHPELFVHRDQPNLLLPASEFNSICAPFSQVDDLARLVRKDAANKMFKVQYKPGLPSGLCGSVQENQFINCHMPSPIREIEGDYKPFVDYLEHLIPEASDRHELSKWCATLINNPEIRMSYGVLLVSENQGTGKSTLGMEILRPLVGEHNASMPSEKQMVDNQFNSWAGFKRLAVVNEIYQGNSSKAYNELKGYITEKHFDLHIKHQTPFSIENWIHIYACSNSMRALKLAMDDRRWLIPKVSEYKRGHEYWEGFYGWLATGGLSLVKFWARKFIEEHGPVWSGEEAPMTGAKRDMIEESFSKGMIVAKWLLEGMKQAALDSGEELFTTDVLIVDAIKQRAYEGKDVPFLEKPLTIRKLAKDVGLFIGDDKDRSFSLHGERGRLLATGEGLARSKQAALYGNGRKPFDTNMIVEKM